jgi:sigma-B regulation protein RsbQ
MDVRHRNHVTEIQGPGRTILYAHGFGCNQDMWSAVTPAFSGEHRQILFDYVGSGKSDLSAFDLRRYSELAGYAQDVLDVCDALELKSEVVFVGHSVSCSIGVLAAIQRPELFRQLVLIGPNPCFVNDPPYVGGFERRDLEELLQLMDRNFLGWAEFLAPVVGGASAPTSLRLRESFCSTDPLVAKTFAKVTFFADNRADLPRVQTPCLILQHRQDTLAPLAVGEYLTTQLPKSDLKVLDVAGHCAHMSHPDLIVEAIRSVLPS